MLATINTMPIKPWHCGNLVIIEDGFVQDTADKAPVFVFIFNFFVCIHSTTGRTFGGCHTPVFRTGRPHIPVFCGLRKAPWMFFPFSNFLSWRCYLVFYFPSGIFVDAMASFLVVSFFSYNVFYFLTRRHSLEIESQHIYLFLPLL
jgi:hypothetical protein